MAAKKKNNAKTAKKANSPKKSNGPKKSHGMKSSKSIKSPAKTGAATSASRPARTNDARPKGLQLSQGAIGITVGDLQQSLAFYCDIVGFTIKQRWERDGVLHGAELVAGDVSVYVGQDDWAKGRDRVKGQGSRMYWYTKQNIDAIAAGITARGGTLASQPKDEWGVRSFNLVDPDGFLITVSSEWPS